MIKRRKFLIKRKPKPKKKPTQKSISKLKKILWVLCREVTRATFGNTCYTCKKAELSGSNWQTGHFITSSTCSTAMRFDLRNLRPQCYHCNINLSGNWVLFERNLKKDGQDVQELKTQNDLGKGIVYPREWFDAKIAAYQQLLANQQSQTTADVNGV